MHAACNCYAFPIVLVTPIKHRRAHRGLCMEANPSMKVSAGDRYEMIARTCTDTSPRSQLDRVPSSGYDLPCSLVAICPRNSIRYQDKNGRCPGIRIYARPRCGKYTLLGDEPGKCAVGRYHCSHSVIRRGSSHYVLREGMSVRRIGSLVCLSGSIAYAP